MNLLHMHLVRIDQVLANRYCLHVIHSAQRVQFDIWCGVATNKNNLVHVDRVPRTCWWLDECVTMPVYFPLVLRGVLQKALKQSSFSFVSSFATYVAQLTCIYNFTEFCSVMNSE